MLNKVINVFGSDAEQLKKDLMEINELTKQINENIGQLNSLLDTTKAKLNTLGEIKIKIIQSDENGEVLNEL